MVALLSKRQENVLSRKSTLDFRKNITKSILSWITMEVRQNICH